jgi:hypothetical protein
MFQKCLVRAAFSGAGPKRVVVELIAVELLREGSIRNPSSSSQLRGIIENLVESSLDCQ